MSAREHKKTPMLNRLTKGGNRLPYLGSKKVDGSLIIILYRLACQ